MAAVFSTSDDASIALLRGLRSGAADFTFVHRVDVCAAAPEDLVAGLEPVPGTGLADDGCSSVWLFYCPKRFKNAQGKPSGHRHRAIAGGDNTCWHSETRPKEVEGSEGGTACNLSYGRKENGSSRSFNRLGWCMTEYDDNHGGGDHVLCKIYRSSSSLAKQKSKSLSGSKRKATSDHAESLPATKMAHCGRADQEQQVQVQENTLVSVTQQQNTPSLFPAQGDPDCDLDLQSLANAMFTFDELLGDGGNVVNPNTQSYGFSNDELISSCSCTPTAMAPPDDAFFQGLAF